MLLLHTLEKRKLKIDLYSNCAKKSEKSRIWRNKHNIILYTISPFLDQRKTAAKWQVIYFKYV